MQFLKNTKKSNLTCQGFFHQLRKYPFLGQQWMACLQQGVLIFQLRPPGSVLLQSLTISRRNAGAVKASVFQHLNTKSLSEKHRYLEPWTYEAVPRIGKQRPWFSFLSVFHLPIYLQFSLFYSVFSYGSCSAPFIFFSSSPPRLPPLLPIVSTSF